MEPAGQMWSVVTESPKMPSARAPLMSCDWPGVHAEALEERRLGDVGRLGPVVHLAASRSASRPTAGCPCVKSAYRRRKIFGSSAYFMQACTSSDVGQMSLQVHVLAVLALAQRLGHQVLQHGAGDGVGDHQRRRGEEVGAQVRVDARLEVAVARKHRGADEVVLDDGLLDGLGERAGVADAGGAAVGRRRRSRASPGRAAGRPPWSDIRSPRAIRARARS